MIKYLLIFCFALSGCADIDPDARAFGTWSVVWSDGTESPLSVNPLNRDIISQSENSTKQCIKRGTELFIVNEKGKDLTKLKPVSLKSINVWSRFGPQMVEFGFCEDITKVVVP